MDDPTAMAGHTPENFRINLMSEIPSQQGEAMSAAEKREIQHFASALRAAVEEYLAPSFMVQTQVQAATGSPVVSVHVHHQFAGPVGGSQVPISGLLDDCDPRERANEIGQELAAGIAVGLATANGDSPGPHGPFAQ